MASRGVVERPLDVREEDRHRLAHAGGPAEEHLNADGRQVGAALRDRTKLCQRTHSLPTELEQSTPRTFPRVSSCCGVRGTAAIIPLRHKKGTPVAAAALQT